MGAKAAVPGYKVYQNKITVDAFEGLPREGKA